MLSAEQIIKTAEEFGDYRQFFSIPREAEGLRR
jgi:hypothetical protein